MTSHRSLEALIVGFLMIAVLIGGRAYVVNVAQFHGVAVSMLVVVGIVVVYAFRRNFLAGGSDARLQATSIGCFLAAIAAAIAFVVSPARWSLGATIAAVEFGLLMQLLSRFLPWRQSSGS